MWLAAENVNLHLHFCRWTYHHWCPDPRQRLTVASTSWWWFFSHIITHTHTHASFALSLHGHDLCDYFLLIYDSPGCGGHSALSRSGLRDWPSSGHEEEDPLPLQTPVWQTWVLSPGTTILLKIVCPQSPFPTSLLCNFICYVMCTLTFMPIKGEEPGYEWRVSCTLHTANLLCTSQLGLSAMIRGADNRATFLVKDYCEDQVEAVLEEYFTSIKWCIHYTYGTLYW